MMQQNEDFTFDRITKNYNKYFCGPKENETKYEEIHAEKMRLNDRNKMPKNIKNYRFSC